MYKIYVIFCLVHHLKIKDKDKMQNQVCFFCFVKILYLKHLALLVTDRGVLAWLVHAQGHAVDQDHCHGCSLKPSANKIMSICVGWGVK